MKDNVSKWFLGIIAFCLCGLLLKETAGSVKAQSPPMPPAGGQMQIAAGGSQVYVLMDRKLYVYAWESKRAKEMAKEMLGDVDIKLNRISVIDFNAKH